MCWNASVSLATFIAGSLIALLIGVYALRKKQYVLAALSFGWLWPISMQLWEYFAWNNASWSWSVAYVSNITQILVLYIVFITVSPSSWPVRLVAGLVVLVYMFTVLYSNNTVRPEIAQEAHLHYNWWDHSWSNTMYILSLIFLFLLLVRPIAWSIVCIVILMIMLIASSILYNHYVSSLWCFFAVAFPPLALLSYSMIGSKN